MVSTRVCLGLVPIKVHPKMCSFKIYREWQWKAAGFRKTLQQGVGARWKSLSVCREIKFDFHVVFLIVVLFMCLAIDLVRPAFGFVLFQLYYYCVVTKKIRFSATHYTHRSQERSDDNEQSIVKNKQNNKKYRYRLSILTQHIMQRFVR